MENEREYGTRWRLGHPGISIFDSREHRPHIYPLHWLCRSQSSPTMSPSSTLSLPITFSFPPSYTSTSRWTERRPPPRSDVVSGQDPPTRRWAGRSASPHPVQTREGSPFPYKGRGGAKSIHTAPGHRQIETLAH